MNTQESTAASYSACDYTMERSQWPSLNRFKLPSPDTRLVVFGRIVFKLKYRMRYIYNILVYLVSRCSLCSLNVYSKELTEEEERFLQTSLVQEEIQVRLFACLCVCVCVCVCA